MTGGVGIRLFAAMGALAAGVVAIVLIAELLRSVIG